MARRVVLAIAAGLLAAACSSGGHSTPGPSPSSIADIKVYGDCRTPTIEPTQIVMACADFGERFKNLQWTNWTSANATGVGTFSYNDCTPNCANGHFHDVSNVRVTLSSPVNGPDGAKVWSRLQMQPAVDHFPAVESLPIRPD